MARGGRSKGGRWRWRLLRLVIFVPLGLVLAAGLWLLSSLPQTTGRLTLRGLADEVTIARDAAGVPHVTAADERDAAFALGFVHAQDRLFQMELMRRYGAGRLAELIGPAGLQADRTTRTLGLYRLAEQQYALLSPPLRAALDAYAAGVNAYIEQRHALPPEFYLLTARPEPWRPADSLVWGKFMALSLCGNYRSELLRARLLAPPVKLSPEQLDVLYPAYPSDAPVTLGDLASLYRTLPLERMLAALPEFVGPSLDSNNWVVDGGRSVSGKPLLANDPHLGFSTPGIWYLARVDTPALHLAGATSPGTPFMVIGRNQRIGWGFTNTESDVEDVFVEKLDPDDPTRYLTPLGSEAFEIRRETIRVRGEAPQELVVRTTRHGPIISDLGGGVPPAAPGHALALQATFLAPDDRSPESFWALNHATDWASFDAAFRDYVAPQQNVVYADVDGTIGFLAPGRVPIRGKGQGWVPAPGWTGDYDWTGYVPFDALPRGVEPMDGRFISANNKIVPDTYPYFLGRGWDIPNRVERIRALLDETPQQSPDASAAIQADTLSPMAGQLLPLMLEARPADERQEAAMERLRQWDGRMAMDAAEPLIFTAWLRELARGLLEDRLGRVFGDYWELKPFVVRDILTSHPEWCSDADPPVADNCPTRLTEALGRALDRLTQDYGADMANWRWGAAHVATFAHPVLSHVPMLGDLLAVAIPAGGGDDTVNRGGMFIRDPRHPFSDVHGASFRMVLDFADLDGSRFMVAPGQSGNPLSAHYADLLHRWRDFEWLRLGAEAGTQADTLTLVPR
jgi:penicillin amidase